MHIKTLDGRLDITSKERTMLIVSLLDMPHLKNWNKSNSYMKAGRLHYSKGLNGKRKYDKYQIQEIMHKRDLGQGYGQIAKAMGMSRSTVSTIVKRELDAVVGIQ